MNTKPEISEQEILRQMENHVNASPGGTSQSAGLTDAAIIPGTGVHGFDFSRLRQSLDIAHALGAEVGTINPRPPGRLNDVIQISKKAMRRLLSWYTRPLQMYHGAVARAMQHQLRALESLQQQINALKVLRVTQMDLQKRVSAQQEQLDALRALQIAEQLDALRTLRIEERLRSQELKVRRLDSSQRVGLNTAQPVTSAQASSQPTGQVDFDYLLFEEYHRGNESLIKERQQAYVQYFEGREPVWDLGCGRGEFLEQLRDRGIVAEGVESGRDSFHLCQEKGLRVTQGDLFAFLEAAPDCSAGGIFAAQVIEHLPVELQLRLVDLCYRKLKPGSPLVLETINPECVFALVRNFYLDPTHVRPVHPEFLRFAMETKGFRDVQVKFSSPVEGKYLQTPPWKVQPGQEEMAKTVLNLNNFVFGCQDYAAVAWCPDAV